MLNVYLKPTFISCARMSLGSILSLFSNNSLDLAMYAADSDLRPEDDDDGVAAVSTAGLESFSTDTLEGLASRLDEDSRLLRDE